MATVQQNISKKTGEVINWKWTALLGRDEDGKQIKITKRVEPYGLKPAKEAQRQREEANAWEREQRAEYEKIKRRENDEKITAWKEKNKITFEDFVNNRWIPKYVEHGTTEKTPDTIQFFKNSAKFIVEYFNTNSPGIKLSQMDIEDVLDFLSWMQNDATWKKKNKITGEEEEAPYSKTTVQHHFSTLRNIFEYAVYTKYISSNPCKEVRQDDRPKREKNDIDFLDEDEAIRFITTLDSEEEKNYWKREYCKIHHKKKENIRQNEIDRGWYYDYLFFKCMVHIFITTGLRRGELIGLQWGDIDRDNLLFVVQRNVTQDTSNKGSEKPEDKIHVGPLKKKGKNEKREVPFLSYILPMLDELKAEQEKMLAVVTLSPTAYIFSRRNDPSLPLYPTVPTRLMQHYIKRHGLPNVSPHDLRHTAGYLAKVGGADVKDIQAMYGHNDPAISLKHYVAFSHKTQRRTAEGIGAVLFPKSDKSKSQA